MILYFTAATTHFGCQKIRSMFRVLGMYNFETVFASRTTCAISVKGGETFTYSERNNGAGWLYLQQKLREKFHIHEYIRQPEHRICFKPFLQKSCYLLANFLHAFWTVLVLLHNLNSVQNVVEIVNYFGANKYFPSVSFEWASRVFVSM